MCWQPMLNNVIFSIVAMKQYSVAASEYRFMFSLIIVHKDCGQIVQGSLSWPALKLDYQISALKQCLKKCSLEPIVYTTL